MALIHRLKIVTVVFVAVVLLVPGVTYGDAKQNALAVRLDRLTKKIQTIQGEQAAVLEGQAEIHKNSVKEESYARKSQGKDKSGPVPVKKGQGESNI